VKPGFGNDPAPEALDPRTASLFDAARSGDLAAVTRLLAAGVPADATGFPDVPWDQTPLMYAARHGHASVVAALLAAGASPAARDANARDSEGGHQPLHHAVRGGHVDVIARLLAAGADVNALTTFGNPPLNLAIRAGHRDVARLLLDRGASVRLKAGRRRYVPPLYGALDAGHPWPDVRDWVQFLLAAGADPNAPGDRGMPPLTRAAVGHDAGPERLAVIEALLKAGADANRADRDGTTPLQAAVLYNDPAVAAALCAAGANTATQTPRGSLLDIAHDNLAQAEKLHADSAARPDLRPVAERRRDAALSLIDTLRRHGTLPTRPDAR
jgi:ankyrin repeat protein